MGPPNVTIATPAARGRVVDAVVAAFADDPAFRFFFQDHAAFPEQAAAFAGYLFDRRVRRNSVWIVDGGTSVAMWDPPSGANGEPGPAPETRPTLDLPPDALARLEGYEVALHELLPGQPHWYLGVLATHPDAAGRGWGRAAMAAGVRRAASDGLPAYLETTNPGNVGMYQRAGWNVADRLSFRGLNVWVMCHEGTPG